MPDLIWVLIVLLIIFAFVGGVGWSPLWFLLFVVVLVLVLTRL